MGEENKAKKRNKDIGSFKSSQLQTILFEKKLKSKIIFSFRPNPPKNLSNIFLSKNNSTAGYQKTMQVRKKSFKLIKMKAVKKRFLYRKIYHFFIG
jgi:hypothetical protein